MSNVQLLCQVSLFRENATEFECRDVDQVVDITDVDALWTIILGTRPWAPGIYENNRRSNKDLKSIGLLVLDIDDGCTLAEAGEHFFGYKNIIATTKSHQKEKNGIICDRFRVILFLETPATSDAEYKEYWFAAYQMWPFIDKACKDSARFFFPCKDVWRASLAGASFSEKQKPQTKALTKQRATKPLVKARLSRATLEFLANGTEAGDWHRSFFKAATDFKEQGFEIEEAFSKLEKVTGELQPETVKTIEDVYYNRESKYGPRKMIITDWPVYAKDLRGNEITGKPASGSVANWEHYFSKLGAKFTFNEFDGLIYINDTAIQDSHLDTYLIDMKANGLSIGKDVLYSFAHKVALENKFNPVKDIIESVAWDGKDRIRELFSTLKLGPIETEIAEGYEMYLRKWILGIVKKLYVPGSQNLVLTLQGPQGIGKSRWFEKFALWPNAAGEGSIDPSNKDHELRHLTHLVWHIPELDYTTGKRETGALKDYLTKATVSVRPAFARTVRHGKSICSFCASVNSEKFLVDPTGNRRFLVIPALAVDHLHTVNMQQVMAQAKVAIDAGEKHWLSDLEQEFVNRQNEAFEIVDQVNEAANRVQPGTDSLTNIELMGALGIENPKTSEIIKFGNLMAKKGIPKSRTQIGGVKAFRYLVKDPKKPNFGAGNVLKHPVLKKDE